MKLVFTFEGIKLIDGLCPRAVVVATFPILEVPDELANVRITVSLPISRIDDSLSVISEKALSTAQLLVNESVAAQWIADQPLGGPTIASVPGDAAIQRAGG